jgi:AAA-like domain/CHAT domain
VANAPNSHIFVVGGPVQAGDGVYLQRPADQELLKVCLNSEYAYVLTPRQMGKSSLMFHTREKLTERGVKSAIVDLTEIGGSVNAEQWYFGILTVIEGRLDLELGLNDWWETHIKLGPAQRFTLFFEQVLLAQVKEPIVIFLDEIDTTLSTGVHTYSDDFFAAIRAPYTARARTPELKRLSFVLIGVATPNELINDPKRTPFNIGRSIDLTDFTLEQARPLTAGFAMNTRDGENTLNYVLKWTAGHPYLTQLLCREIARSEQRTWTEQNVDDLVKTTYFSEQGGKDNNLVFVRNMLTERVSESDKDVILGTYRDIRRGNPVPDEERSLVKSHLKISGLVRVEGSLLQVRNAIYARVFDENFIDQHLGEESARRALQAANERADEEQRLREAQVRLFVRERQETSRQIGTKPIVFLAFANEQSDSRYLRDLAYEKQQILQVLEPAREICDLVLRPNVTFEEIVKGFLESKDRIAVFHFSGYDTSYRLLLEASNNSIPKASNNSSFAQFLAQRNNLKLVFLSGSSTQADIDDLRSAGVPAVIANVGPVSGLMTRYFAEAFYQSLAIGSSVRRAFLDAQASIDSRAASTDSRDESSSDWQLFTEAEDKLTISWTLAELAQDPTFGLPAIPRTDLPAKPFRHLSWFRREDAEIFFGRGASIRDLYERITGDGDPIILLYGQSGVGKSSLLDAGVRPRLEANYEVRYVRRDEDLGLLGILRGFDTHQIVSLRDAWLELEQRLHKPVVIILDQLEEVFTRPNANLPDELNVFLNAVQTLTGNPRPQGKLILGFSKEFLAEIERLLEAHHLSFSKYFLEPLNRDGVIEAVKGPSTRKRLIEKYGLEVSADLPEVIAQDMLEDRGSPVATTLQILLTRMYDEAITYRHEPRFDLNLYQHLKRRGSLLGDFLDQQLEQLSGTHPTESSSGLALDVLAYHTTALSTAEQRGANELKLEYGNRDGLEGLLQALKDLYLLAEASGDGPEGGWPTRLSHDTLAPLVRKLFDHSDKPGQRAKRILENRAVEWAGGMVGTPLDERDLEVVEDGQMGMRALRPDEVRMLEVSLGERKKRELEREAQKRDLEVRLVRDRRIFWGGIGLALVALVFAGLAYWQR